MRNKLSILVVDDDDVDVEFIKRCLKKQKIPLPLLRVRTAPDALAYLRSQSDGDTPSTIVALVDSNIPGTSGLELLHEIKHDTSLKNTISFLLSTYPSPEERRMAHKEGAIGYFLKSETPELVAILNDIIRDE